MWLLHADHSTVQMHLEQHLAEAVDEDGLQAQAHCRVSSRTQTCWRSAPLRSRSSYVSTSMLLRWCVMHRCMIIVRTLMESPSTFCLFFQKPMSFLKASMSNTCSAHTPSTAIYLAN